MSKPSILSKLNSGVESSSPPMAHPLRQRVPSTAIAGLGRSLDDLAADSVATIDPALIDPSPFGDRLEYDEEATNLLLAAIEAEGQRLPLLVRPHPKIEGRYQLAYGHRRLQVLRILNRKAKAFIRNLTDAELILEQGAENGGREGLTWIERALFAKEMEGQGHPSKTIWTTIGVDKSGLSKMRAVVDTIPDHLIRSIGRAPGIGQPRWQELVDALAIDGAIKRAASILQSKEISSLTSDQKFVGLLRALCGQSSLAPHSGRREIRSSEGRSIARLSSTAKGDVLAIAKAESRFSAWLTEKLPEIYRQFLIEGATSTLDSERPATGAADSDGTMVVISQP
ncbi:plasmid partitioning protein RepB [Methylocapsa palsarum]|uniref:Chromosome partitioning protein, ParB family n=1 Tax=Methylocapsa palsarum TaxID=1612308 RepID=A0A1I4B7J2_9HYPH|nr:plasmid partitioning protein RepB [Methylocapsa palsarum]SFK63961.1 chromosome partitioning protein, ParB family [Methylocapsa palsarum]